MSDIEKEKDVSCFSVDGVVAEMVIEVEENQKSAFDDFKDLASSPDKDTDNDKKSDNLDSERKLEVFESEKKEDKENFIEIVEARGNDDLKEKNTDKKKNQNMNVNKSLKRKRKSELIMNSSENENNEGEEPRYPGRKRLANKRYISEDMVTSETKKSESVDLKYSPKGTKKRKLGIDSKEKEAIKDVSNSDIPRKFSRSKEHNINAIEETETATKESGKTNKTIPLKKKEANMEVEKPLAKQDILRKLPFRKNRDAPDVPDLKPKVFWWNGVGDGHGVKLGDIPEIKDRVEEAKSIRALYRVLFFQWPSNGRDLIGQILQFNGFPFDKTSYEFTKRQSLMKIMLDNTISHICDMLDLKKGDKPTMIRNILEFLLKPYAKIDPAQDPSLQPVVVLERIVLDNKFFYQASEDVKSRLSRSKYKEKALENTYVTPTRTTRGSSSRIELVKSSDTKKSAEKSKEDLKANRIKLSRETDSLGQKSVIKDKTPSSKDAKGKTTFESRDFKAKVSSGIKESKLKTTVTKDKDNKTKSVSVVKDNNKGKNLSLVKNDVKYSSKDEKSKNEVKSAVKVAVSSKVANKSMQNKKGRKASPVNNKKVSEKKSKESSDSSDESETEMTDSGSKLKDSAKKHENLHPSFTKDAAYSEASDIFEENFRTQPIEKNQVTSGVISDSSETESAEETRMVSTPRKSAKVPLKRKGKPLKHFLDISESIQKANFSALQRLHILLFGASDKAENLKSNILAFGGFPFLEGSDEWKQKHFLLSLLAQNNLREYLNLLCIKYSNDDHQPSMINKLMRFLAVPSEESLENKIQENKIQLIETEVVSSELVSKSPTILASKVKIEAKKKVKKKEKKGVGPRQRKVLMSEEEARRLEASFAREQRALARENKSPPYPPVTQTINVPVVPSSLTIHPVPVQPRPQARPIKPPATDPNQLNALLQTVYKRRALKAAGAVVSTPNKGEKTKLGEIENIKFLIVTSNLTDLDMLHNLIFMVPAAKSRVRKNIMDFEGFGFNEDSPKYKQRMDYLKSLGYEASKRMSFLLGLCPLQTDIPQQDLNELIMYFLMSPCKPKQVVPITEMPPSDEPHIIVKSTAPIEKPVYYQSVLKHIPIHSSDLKKASSSANKVSFQSSTPLSKTSRQKARKSFPSNLKVSPVKKVLLPPSQSPVLGIAPLGSKTQKMTLLNSVPAVPAFSLPRSTVHNSANNVTLVNTSTGISILTTPNTPVNSLVKVPVDSLNSKIQILNQSGSNVAVLDTAAKAPMNTIPNVSGQILSNQILIPQISNKIGIQPQQNIIPPSVLQSTKMLVKNSASPTSPQEFLVQQQTPDGKQKTFKLIRLPPNHPLASNGGKPLVQQTTAPPQVQQPIIFTGAPLITNNPPGIIIMKNSASLPSVPNLQGILQNAPIKINMPANVTNPSFSSSLFKTTVSNTQEIVLQEDDEPADTFANSSQDNSLEVIAPSESPPTDEDLFSSIQEIILSSNFEDITLRNVIERVAAQFPHHDLTHRHNYMKECVKKIIIGT